MAGLEEISVYKSLHSCECNSNVDYARRNERMDRQENHYAAVIWLYFFISVGITLAIVPILTLISIDQSKHKHHPTNETPSVNSSEANLTDLFESLDTTYYNYRFVFIKVLRGTFSSTVGVLFLWLVVRKSRLTGNEAQWSIMSQETISNDLHQRYHHSSLYGAAMFLGLGSVVMFCFMVVTSIQCAIYEQTHDSKIITGSFVLSIINNIIFLLLLISQLVFFYSYNKAVFLNPVGQIFHFTMAMGISSNVWNWSGFTFTSPLWEHVYGEQFHDAATWCSGDEYESMKMLTKIQRYLSILFPEFSIIAISLLYCHWMTMIHHQRPLKNTRQSGGRITFGMQADADEHSVLLHSQLSSQSSKKLKCRDILLEAIINHPLVTILSLVFGLFYLLVNILSHYAIWGWIETEYKEITAVVQLSSEATIFLPAVIVIIKCLRNFKHIPSKSLPLSGNDYLLIFASTWAVIYDLLQLFAIADMLKRKIYLSLAIVGIGVSIIFTTQTCLQTLFLITINRRRVDNHLVQNKTRACLIFLVIINTVNWLVTGLTHEWAVESKFVPIITIGFDHVDFETDTSGQNLTIGSTVILIVYPMLSLYRFHSAVICYEMLKSHHPMIQPQPTLVFNSDSDEFSND